MLLLEKKQERERSKAEAIQEDISFKTMMGNNQSQTHRASSSLSFSPSLPPCSLSLSLSLSAAKNIYRSLFLSKPPEKNEHFFPGRMVRVCVCVSVCVSHDVITTGLCV